MSIKYKGYTIPELINDNGKLFDTNEIEIFGPPAIFNNLLVIKNTNSGDRITTDIDVDYIKTELNRSGNQLDNMISKLNEFITHRCKMLINKREGNK